MIIELPIKMPSMNEIYAGVHWSKRAKRATELHDLVFYAVKAIKKPESFKTCRIKYVCWFKDKRKHDPDNLGVKYFQDGLVRAGIIEDDNSEVVKSITIEAKTGQEMDKIIINIENDK